jgi:polyisoprenoid-binding protein YceI
MTAISTESIPGYVTGVWDIDSAHSDVSFSVRHMMVSKVRGRFGQFSGQIVTTADATSSSVTAEIDLSSIDTGNQQRDDHVRSADFFDADANKTMTYRSTAIAPAGDRWLVEGELTLKGVTRPVKLNLELNGFSPDPWGGTRVGFTATTEINRSDFGVTFNIPLDGGGVVVSDRVQIQLEIEAVLQAA